MKPKTAYKLFKWGILGSLLGAAVDVGALIVICGIMGYKEANLQFLGYLAYHLLFLYLCTAGKEELESQYEKKDLE